MTINIRWSSNIWYLTTIFLLIISIKNILIKCFNHEGHEAIGMVTMSGLKNNQLYELKKILNGKDIVDIGRWCHLVHSKIKGAESMHYNLQNNDCQKAIFKCEDENGLCLINSIKYFYNKLMETPNSSNYSDNENEKTKEIPNKIIFKYPKNINFTDSDSLKYLVSLIADMHQPLRISYKYDNGGRNIKIYYRNNQGAKIKSTLFEYIENDLINKMIEKYQSSWYSGWTHINRIYDQHKKDEILFKEKGINAIEIWATEIVNDFCYDFYLNNYVSSFLTNVKNELHFNTNKEIDIPKDLEFQFERLIKLNILKAGSRISIILNHIFANKSFSNFRKISELDKGQYDKLENYNSSSTYKRNALLINLAILLSIVVIILYYNFVINKKRKTLLPNKMVEVELKNKSN
ncbi:P1 nuclease, putative [Plasmodium berghei]|uniref:Plasma membrane protein 1 n=2 Tax=Plasmodium berghei TaxID=5821 RepID=A0A509AKB0_PLABA|nr:plasma membrane protein 1 [Plasmodium berghei ANKA]CXI30750.1 P1 nuclease, putative [Plasmodium berghei]SCM20898.1 P1 nuclease, putative [Plasmodium berghei]SCN24372.1 P1 nuclease, putative [Plasmodium berghei]SCO59548.1 P1 nuclease, putative [Plasmodium berghei]SCO60763.1 P1 nuclease, putative [Plasmodium berghei]|eukprot:XP_034421065.1 plasma membrane protein 1 [Plasmodium berghei ANKA]